MDASALNTIIVAQMLISADTHIRRICRINRSLFIFDKIFISHEIYIKKCAIRSIYNITQLQY